MDLMSIIGKAAARAELDEAEIDFLRNYRPDANAPAASGSPPEEFETLKTSLAEAAAERDRLRSELDGVRFRQQIDELAGRYRFSDRGYLEYLCRQNGVDPAEPEKCGEFINSLRERMPRFFRCELQGETLPDASNGNSGAAAANARTGELPLAELLMQAPVLD